MPTTDGFPPVLADCRDAEDYFRVLGVEYDERVVMSGRLHILRLFGLELEGLCPVGDDRDLVVCRAALKRAYQALVSAGPLQHRVFKVLKERAPGQFVAEADILFEDPIPLFGDPIPASGVLGGEGA